MLFLGLNSVVVGITFDYEKVYENCSVYTVQTHGERFPTSATLHAQTRLSKFRVIVNSGNDTGVFPYFRCIVHGIH